MIVPPRRPLDRVRYQPSSDRGLVRFSIAAIALLVGVWCHGCCFVSRTARSATAAIVFAHQRLGRDQVMALDTSDRQPGSPAIEDAVGMLLFRTVS